MERDFWNGIRPLGHVTLLVSPKDFWMTDVLYAKGYDKTDGETPIYFWGLGSYKYEIESRPLYKNVFITKSDVFEASYEDAREKFEAMIEPDTEVLM